KWGERTSSRCRTGARPADHLEETERLLVGRVLVQDLGKAAGGLFIVPEHMVSKTLLEKLANPFIHGRSSRFWRTDSQRSIVCCRPERSAAGSSPFVAAHSRAPRRQASALATAAVPKVLSRISSRTKGNMRSPFS